MNKYLWIGVNLDDFLLNNLKKNNLIVLSAFKSQSTLFEGLEIEGGFVFDSINGYRLPYYPKYKSLFIKRHEWSHNLQAKDVSIGYCNFPYFSHINKTKSFINEAKKYIKLNKDNEINIFIYSLQTPFLKCAEYIKKHCFKVNIFLIIPDLPQFMDANMSMIKRIMKKIDWKILEKKLFLIDKFILYSEHMASFLKLKKEKYIVMEGCIKKNLFEGIDISKKNHEINVLYMGAINHNYGIDKLIESFKNLKDKRVKLRLYGQGNAVPYVLKNCSKNIIYEGYLSNFSDVLTAEKNADLLINIRDPNNINLLKYSFPSKILEYMYSGNPVLTMKAEGIPKEYNEYLYFYHSLNHEEIEKIINRIVNLNEKERAVIAERNIRFIESKKLQLIQCKKIIDFTMTH